MSQRVVCVPDAKCPLGELLIHAGALEKLVIEDLLVSLLRHQCGDWGGAVYEEADMNEYHLATAGWIVSEFIDRNGNRFRIATWNSGRFSTRVELVKSDERS